MIVSGLHVYRVSRIIFFTILLLISSHSPASFLKRDIKVGILIGIYITLPSILYYFVKYIILLCQVSYITLPSSL